MKRTVRAVALLMAGAMVAAACSKPESNKVSGTSRTTTPEVAAPVTAAPGETTTTAAAGPAGSATAKAGAKGVPTVRRNVDDSQARAVGALIKPQSTARRKPYYSGVTDDTIQLDFSYDKEICGVNTTAALTAAGGALPTPTRYYRAAPRTADEIKSDTEETIKVMVDYWNTHAFEAAEYAPEIRKLMGNDASHQWFGRKLVYKTIDGGSTQCPDKTTAAAKQAANEDHALVVFNNLESASSAGAYNMAANLNTIPADRRPMHFGTLWLPDSIYDKFAPFAWTQFATGSTITRQLASYICSRVAGRKVDKSGDGSLNGKDRKFGLVHTNLQQDKQLANELKGYLNQYCGRDIIGSNEVEYDGQDFSKAQQDSTNLVLQLKLADVTSVIMLTDPIAPLFQMREAQSQGYFPEWIWSSFGYGDSSTVQRIYKDIGKENQGSFGLSQLGVYGGFGFSAGDPFAMYHALHLTAPDGKPCDPSSNEGMEHGGGASGAIALYCKAPTPLVTWYYTMLPFAGGMLFAGPDLTPQNVTAGLQHYPTTRYGGSGPTSDPRPALVGAGLGKHGFIVDGVEWKWHQEYTSPEPESKAQWVEYPDCMRHYLLWPDDLAPNWHKSEPAYNDWCGDAKTGFPRTTEKDRKPY